MIINQIEPLKKWLKVNENSDWLALDTEFLRVSNYYPKLCLLQLATDNSQICIDMLAIKDFDDLFAYLYAPKRLWIVHSGRQDLEILYQQSGQLPKCIFDSQIAAYFLNYPHQIAYKALVETICQVDLAKAHTRFDWSIRPLPADVLRYAVDDVLYLPRIYQTLTAMLKKRDIFTWCQAETAQQLLDKKYYEVDLANIWQRVKIGKQSFTQTTFYHFICLAAYRELKAQKKDKPRHWLMSDESLIYYANHIDKFNDKTALSSIENDYPALKTVQLPKAKPLTQAEKKTKEALRKQIEKQADKHQLPVTLLATNKQLNAFVLKKNTDLIEGWRGELLKLTL